MFNVQESNLIKKNSNKFNFQQNKSGSSVTPRFINQNKATS